MDFELIFDQLHMSKNVVVQILYHIICTMMVTSHKNMIELREVNI